MRKNKLFLALLFLALLLVSVLGINNIYAGKQEVINEINTGIVNIEIEEYQLNEQNEEILWKNNKDVLPGMTVSWIPYIKSTGNDCYVRVKIDVEQAVDTEQPITLNNFNDISNDWVLVDDYYYYKHPLKTNEKTDFFHSFTVPGEWDDSVNPRNIGEWDFSITLIFDAVQSDNFTPDFESHNPWDGLVVKESKQKDGYDINIFTTTTESEISIVIEDYDNIVIKPDNFFEGLDNMVPGDTLSDTVTIKSNKNSEIFFSTDSLSDIELLKNVGLTLALHKDGKTNVIYDGVLDSNIHKLSLGKYDKKEESKLTFTIHMPKELDNEFSLRNASVKWVFDVVPNKNGNPKTNDDNMSIVALIVLMCASIIIIVLIMKKKKEKDDGRLKQEVNFNGKEYEDNNVAPQKK